MKREDRKYLIYRQATLSVILAVFALGLLIGLPAASKLTMFPTILLFLFIVYFMILYGYYRLVLRPYRETKKMMDLFSKGYILQGIFELRYPLCPATERMNSKFKEMLNTKELISASKKQAEYLALQNQINPHFLYNTLEGIRSEALYAGITEVALMTEALSSFFRYTISNVEHMVTLEEELNNVKNYFIIQQFRFEDRLSISIDTGIEKEELLSAKIPKLTLQPVVENAIYHGLEEKIGKGIVRIKIESTGKRLIITISDNGLGMTEEKVIALNKKFRAISLDGMKQEDTTKSGIALMNVNSRIKLLFGDEYGLYIYSTQNEGTDVEITIPFHKE
ncbi:sensor histidine kinase [Anaerocolumna xylanovorans]|uniref:Two-component system, sensor histidine kinase YesM n=1 Tax=Anaerocolumna xylanovorans DSM 12503 TaxID=1121345 RepID=A0A1M7XZH3_9FIRM|nr:histidine kinase [Anaerocolumna xylanovorans]SHO44550.1 two-component system, sensor histidine kinase YesM [Anaerocolumna xylanovorans DSM 12503]